jgi:hypothetical protein
MTSRFELSTTLAGAFEDTMPIKLLDAGLKAEKLFYALYTGSDRNAKLLLEEIQRKFSGFPRIPLHMKLVATVFNENGQVPSSLANLLERVIGDLLARAKTKVIDPDGLLFAILQLTKTISWRQVE